MNDILGWRKLFGILGPSTNTVVQPEFDDMRPAGVTNHYSRIYTQDAQAISNETFMAGTQIISDNLLAAVDSIMTCNPDRLVMGMSALTFYGGAEGAADFEQKVKNRSGLDVSAGSTATAAALHAYGVKSIAFLSPYFPAANEQVRRFFEESGFSVRRDICLQRPSWTAIAQTPISTLFDTLSSLDGEDVDALVQVGTNLPMAAMAAHAEHFFGKPVIAINTATYWHALRHSGVEDKVSGFGSLLERF
ncbi:MAG: arylmalonate decarboxylase [Pseudomonadota bacterium]